MRIFQAISHLVNNNWIYKLSGEIARKFESLPYKTFSDYSAKMTPINIKTLSESEIKAFINSFDTILSDCDGVLWHQNNAIANAAKTINLFQDLGKRVFYVTNNSTKTREEFVEKCAKLEFKGNAESILCTSYLVAKYLQDIQFKKKVYLIGSSGIAQELDRVGIRHIGLGKDPIMTEELNFDDFKPDPEVGAVVVGFDLHFNYLKMLKAATYLHDNNVIFIGTNTDEQFPGANNLIVPGTGSFVRCIETCAEREAITLGKPSTYVSKILTTDCQVNPERTLMVGDRANTDILLGTRCGFKTLLVLSGVTQLNHLDRWSKSTVQEDKDLLPNYYIDSIGDLLPYLEKFK